MDPILIYDTTLRDGTQGENVNFSAEEKIKIALRLDDLGIHYIEGGWPGSNPRDVQFFELAREVEFKQARLTSFGATRKPGIRPEEDANINGSPPQSSDSRPNASSVVFIWYTSTKILSWFFAS